MSKVAPKFLSDVSFVNEKNNNLSKQVITDNDKVILGNVFWLDEGIYKIVFDEDKVSALPNKVDFELRIKKRYVPQGYKLPAYRSQSYIYYNKSGQYSFDKYERVKVSLNTLQLKQAPMVRSYSETTAKVFDNVTVFMTTPDYKCPEKMSLFYLKEENMTNLFGSYSAHRKGEESGIAFDLSSMVEIGEGLRYIGKKQENTEKQKEPDFSNSQNNVIKHSEKQIKKKQQKV